MDAQFLVRAGIVMLGVGITFMVWGAFTPRSDHSEGRVTVGFIIASIPLSIVGTLGLTAAIHALWNLS